MFRGTTHLLAGLMLAATAFSAAAQEVLAPSRIQAKASRKQPALGLPKRLDGQPDPVIWFNSGQWNGADSLRAAPIWTMDQGAGPAGKATLVPVQAFCADWALEKPQNGMDVVWGPFRGGWFAAICKKTKSPLGWKSIGFVIPPGGIDPAKQIYSYSVSVNWLEHQIGYNLFPKLPPYLQEIIEEITATELLCSFQEFDPGLESERPEVEIDYEWEDDRRERD